MDTVACDLLDDYQDFVASCPQVSGKEFLNQDILFLKGYWAASHLVCEAGEVMELYEKSLRKDIELDAEKVLDECGDTLWCLTSVLNSLGLTLDEAMRYNTVKLQERIYGEKDHKTD